jgi:hypothetical protein
MRTTVNLSCDNVKILKESAQNLNISTHEIITLLMQTAFSGNSLDCKAFKGICYQEKAQDSEWKRFHVTFEPHVYELGLDCRKFFKVSVSFLISFAICNYLDQITGNANIRVDNYPSNYIFIARMFDDVQGFMVFWGIPEMKYLENVIP